MAMCSTPTGGLQRDIGSSSTPFKPPSVECFVKLPEYYENQADKETKLEIFKDTPFFNLLSCDPQKKSTPNFLFLALSYDAAKDAFLLNDKHMKLCAREAALVLGMPEDMEDTLVCKTVSANPELLHRYVNKLVDRQSTVDCLQKMKIGEGNREDFKRIMYYYLYRHVFAPNTVKKKRVDLSALSMVEDIQSFEKHNWAKVMLIKVMENVKKLKDSHTNRRSTTSIELTCFTPLLEAWYYYRSNPSVDRKLENNLKVPLLFYHVLKTLKQSEKDLKFCDIKQRCPTCKDIESQLNCAPANLHRVVDQHEQLPGHGDHVAAGNSLAGEQPRASNDVTSVNEMDKRLQEYISRLQTDLATANATLQRVEKEKSTILENLGTLRGHYASLQEQLTTSRETCSSQRQQLEELNQQLGLANEKLKMADLYVSETRTNYEEQQQLIRQLKDRLAEAEIQIDEKELLRRKLQELKVNLLKLIPTVDA